MSTDTTVLNLEPETLVFTIQHETLQWDLVEAYDWLRLISSQKKAEEIVDAVQRKLQSIVDATPRPEGQPVPKVSLSVAFKFYLAVPPAFDAFKKNYSETLTSHFGIDSSPSSSLNAKPSSSTPNSPGFVPNYNSTSETQPNEPQPSGSIKTS